MQEVDRQLAEVAALWNKVEGWAKEVEQFNRDVAIAGINEMRYAGRRLVDVILRLRAGDTDEQALLVELGIVRNYLVNAEHDFTDAVLVEAHEYVLRVVKRHGRKKVGQHVPEFETLYPSFVSANDSVQKIRIDRAQRNQYYDDLAANYAPKVMALCRRIAETRAVSADKDINWALGLITTLGVIGSVASVVGLILTGWGVWLIFNPPNVNPTLSVPIAETATPPA